MSDKKILDPENGIFSPHDFLGLQQSLCNIYINFSFGIFMSKYAKKKLLKCTTVITESVKVVDFENDDDDDDLFSL